MKSAQIKSALLFTVLTLAFPICHAGAYGGSDGGGGDAVICYSTEATKQAVEKALGNRETKSFEQEIDLHLQDLVARPTMLEIFENEGVKVEKEQIQENVHLELFPGEEAAVQKVLTGDSAFFMKYSKFVSRPFQWTAKQYGVVEINDSTGVARIPNTCLLVQIAYFDDQAGTINYDARLFSIMDDRNRLALKFHEDLYKMWRTFAKNNALELENILTRVNRTVTDGDREIYNYMMAKYGNVHTSNVIRPLSYQMSKDMYISPEAIQFYTRNVVVALKVSNPSWGVGRREIRNQFNNEVLATKDADWDQQYRGTWTILGQ